MTIKITYCPVSIETKLLDTRFGEIPEYQYINELDKIETIEVDDSLPEYGSEDLSAWIHLAKHLGNKDFLKVYEKHTHESSNKRHWRWIGYLEARVLEVEEVL